MASTWIREKDIFIVFDTIHRQFEGMETRGDNMQNQRRAYIQIIDSGIRTYDHAIRHLESAPIHSVVRPDHPPDSMALTGNPFPDTSRLRPDGHPDPGTDPATNPAIAAKKD